MDTDIHLDTSWCPVCDCAIMPRRYTVPVQPPALPAASSSTAIKSSMTTRGKNGTIKARAGGLVQGTGRMRPVLNRANTAKGKASQRAAEQQEVVEEPLRTRTVIDPSPTPLYCSEECRKRDLEESWPVSPPPTRNILDASRQPSRTHIGEHQSQINPARASPPPPSPTIPPVPPNSHRASVALKARNRELNLDELAACIHEADEHSDSSSATGSSFTASDRSPIEEQDWGTSNLFTDPPPPPLVPLPPHPHRPSAPVVPPGSNKKNRQPKYEGGMMMAAKRLQAYIASGAADDEQTKAERREREEMERQKELRLQRWDYGGGSRSSSNDREKQEEQKLPAIDPTRWTELVYNYSSTSSGTSRASPGIPSTHRRSSDTDPSKKIRALGTPSRTQSALELFAKYPLFALSTSSTAAKPKSNKSSASLATSYAPAYGITASSSSHSTKSSASSVSGRTAGASALTLPGADPEMYAGKKLGGARRPIAQGLKGKLILPDILLRPAVPVSSSLPSGCGLVPPQSTGMRHSGSEANVSARKSGRSTSALGAVREGDGEVETKAEGGVWHRPEEGSEDSRSSVTRPSASDERSRKDKKSRSSRRSPVVEEPAWNYEGSGPLYELPQVPVTQIRYEEVFVPDEPSNDPNETEFIQRSPLYMKDVEISRRAIREVTRRRGEHEGRPGWWVEKEWEVKGYPERKKLFLFGGSKSGTSGR